MSHQNIAIGTRLYTSASSITQELSGLTEKNILFVLKNYGAIQVTGPKAAEFLQGQLSCDIQLVNENSIQQGIQCNLKGRVLTLVDVLYWQKSYWLILPNDLINMTLTSLEKAAMLSRVSLSYIERVSLYGLCIHSPQDCLPNISLPDGIKKVTTTDEGCCYRLSSSLYVLININKLNTGPFERHHQLKHELAWHYLALKQQQFSIYPETRGLFLPHQLNLHNTGFISFNKGCYKGQEIIARMHYRATLKHEFKVFEWYSTTPPQLGKPLLDTTTNQELGELVDYCPINNDQYLVASITPSTRL